MRAYYHRAWERGKKPCEEMRELSLPFFPEEVKEQCSVDNRDLMCKRGEGSEAA